MVTFHVDLAQYLDGHFFVRVVAFLTPVDFSERSFVDVAFFVLSEGVEVSD